APWISVLKHDWIQLFCGSQNQSPAHYPDTGEDADRNRHGREPPLKKLQRWRKPGVTSTAAASQRT
ncbi:hypothetical protein L9F63_007425, partial [Diploptera punctata]